MFCFVLWMQIIGEQCEPARFLNNDKLLFAKDLKTSKPLCWAKELESKGCLYSLCR